MSNNGIAITMRILSKTDIVKSFWWRRKSDCLWYSYCLQFITIVNIRTNKRNFNKFYFDVGYSKSSKSVKSIKDVDIVLRNVAECSGSELQQTWDRIEKEYLKQTIDELNIENKWILVN